MSTTSACWSKIPYPSPAVFPWCRSSSPNAQPISCLPALWRPPAANLQPHLPPPPLQQPVPLTQHLFNDNLVLLLLLPISSESFSPSDTQTTALLKPKSSLQSGACIPACAVSLHSVLPLFDMPYLPHLITDAAGAAEQDTADGGPEGVGGAGGHAKC